jgi:hypothetical protein
MVMGLGSTAHPHMNKPISKMKYRRTFFSLLKAAFESHGSTACEAQMPGSKNRQDITYIAYSKSDEKKRIKHQ